ncbi:Mce protein [Mycobacterium sp. 852002-51163_SCH5372311]|uniref:Mce protein n=1 Tax=Mycobacterium sp. 852002-51163_SCH5372311 TaxID=1834097 RepID=UPI000801AA1E|nr:Mce protein [Mycobacterium sp. 852002-51163_SCH5372311]OBF91189.1 Mce protein [Mycobacterium sp. 852002-51163_SCH5372311]
MEGDAGTSRLNPTDADDSPESEAEQVTTVIETEDSPESQTDQATTEATVEDPPESGTAADQPAAARKPSRLGRGWLAAITAALLLAAAGLGVGGYLALRSHHESQAIARNNAAALKAATDCIAATQAPDTSAMAEAERKIVECGTDEYRSQALMYTSMLMQAYQAANAHVQVVDNRAAVERTNNNGSVNVLVALRVKVSNSAAQNQEIGYRLRVTMMPVEGQYKVSKVESVTK